MLSGARPPISTGLDDKRKRLGSLLCGTRSAASVIWPLPGCGSGSPWLALPLRM
jgi:hypothetical protein